MNNMEWIRLSEKLPEDEQQCWIFTVDKTLSRSEFRLVETTNSTNTPYYDDSYFHGDEFCVLRDVEYWMPYYTPKPPEGETLWNG